MSKPSWDEAPEWAKYLAMDGDGFWSFYEDRPEWAEEANEWWLGFDSTDDSRWAQYGACDESGIDWDHAFDTLERRP